MCLKSHIQYILYIFQVSILKTFQFFFISFSYKHMTRDYILHIQSNYEWCKCVNISAVFKKIQTVCDIIALIICCQINEEEELWMVPNERKLYKNFQERKTMHHRIKCLKAIKKKRKSRSKIYCLIQKGKYTTKNKNGYTKKIQRKWRTEHMNRKKKQGKEGAQMKRTKNRKKANQRVTTIKKRKKQTESSLWKLICIKSRKNKEVSAEMGSDTQKCIG
jgi:hypothetical protein